MSKRDYDQDAIWKMLEDLTMKIIGYGSHGHAYALNLRDSGIHVVVGLYPHRPAWNVKRRQERKHQIEQTGTQLRDMMPWLKK